jgi:hypothetical protein
MNMRKFAIAVCSAAAISIAVAGCASTGGNSSATMTGAQTGAIAGALIGWHRDGLRGALAGALIGGVIGATIGRVVDHMQEKSGDEVRTSYGVRDAIEIENLALSKDVFRGGEQTNIEMRYAVVTSDKDKTIPIAQTIEYFQGDKKISSAQSHMNLEAGQYKTTFALAIPKEAEEGEYKAVARLEGMDKSAQAEKVFRVTYARNGRSQPTIAQVSM